jgi:alpha-beta hydrolase superfamily lysophospholipase
MIKWLYAFILCVLPMAATTSVAKPPEASFYDASLADAARPPGTLLKVESLSMPPLYRARAWRILYSTRDVAGRPIVSSGMVIASTVATAQPSARKIVSWAHPTVGTARRCAPSLQARPHSSILGINDLVGLGYVVVATDYPGLGTPGPIGYLVGKGQAHAMLDAVRAAQSIPAAGAGNDVALWGYSQGGHAALFAAQIASRYAPELKIKGAAAIAPPTDLRRLLLANIDSLEGRVLAAFTLQSWAVKYGLSLRDIASDASLAAILTINRQCIDTVEGQIAVLKAQKKLGRQFLLNDPDKVRGWDAAMRDNSITVPTTSVPLLIVQGESDDIVRPAVTRQVIANGCARGARIKYVTLPGRGHGTSAKFGSASAVSWIAERLTGAGVLRSCP